jgi:hypothetical protein
MELYGCNSCLTGLDALSKDTSPLDISYVSTHHFERVLAHHADSSPPHHHCHIHRPITFLSLPGELRNGIYSYLMPQYVNHSDVEGLLQPCPQIRDELESMLVKCARKVLDHTRKASMAISNENKEKRACPYIATPILHLNSHLRNVKVDTSLGTGQLPSSQPARPVSFTDAFADLRELLSLHLTFVTIRVELKSKANDNIRQTRPGANESIREYWLRFDVLRNSRHAFKRFQHDREIHTKHAIFELGLTQHLFSLETSQKLRNGSL